jgi:hypothetical protein
MLLEVLAGAISWRFKSSRPHQNPSEQNRKQACQILIGHLDNAPSQRRPTARPDEHGNGDRWKAIASSPK